MWVTMSVRLPPSMNSITTHNSSSTRCAEYISTMLGWWKSRIIDTCNIFSQPCTRANALLERTERPADCLSRYPRLAKITFSFEEKQKHLYVSNFSQVTCTVEKVEKHKKVPLAEHERGGRLKNENRMKFKAFEIF